MSKTYQIQGGWTSNPNVSPAPGCPMIQTPFDFTVQLDPDQLSELTLGVDTPVAVDFGGVTSAHVVIIVTDRKVTARLTSTDGATQSVPIEGFFVLHTTGSVPITAIDLTRVAGQSTNVKVFLGQKA